MIVHVGMHHCADSGEHDRATCRCGCSFCILWKRRALVRERTKESWDLLIESAGEMGVQYEAAFGSEVDRETLLRDYVELFSAWFARLDDR